MTTASLMPRAPLRVMLMAVTMAPALTYFLGLASSLAVGTALAALTILVAGTAAPNRLTPALARVSAIFATLCLFLGLHLAIAGLLHPIDVGHAAASLIPLVLVVLGGVALGTTIAGLAPGYVDRGVMFVFWAMVIAVALALAGIRPPIASRYLKPVFPFTEPSHFVLAFMPIYTYTCVAATTSRRLALLAAGLILVVALESLTLAIGWALIAMICVRGLVIPAIITGAAIALVGVLDLSYFTDRLDFSNSTQNLSTLVYLQGWQLASEALAATSGWGVGFQQLGLQGTDTVISRIIYLLVGDDVNIFDGGFGAAKLVGEFGLCGIIALALFVTAATRSLVALRRSVRTRAMPPAQIFGHAAVVGYLIEMFVRGAGYFTGSGLLLVAGLTLVHFRAPARGQLPAASAGSAA